MDDKALIRLAFLHGIMLVDDSVSREESGPCLAALLQAAGLPVHSAADAEELLRKSACPTEPVIIDPVSVHMETELPIGIPLVFSEDNDQEYRWVLTLEGGGQLSGTFSASRQKCAPASAKEYGRQTGRILEIYEKVAPGYHLLAICRSDAGEGDILTSSRLIVTPATCYIPPGLSGDARIWGTSVSLHSIRSKNNWGIGDFADLQQVLSWGATQGAGVLHSGPLHALRGSRNPYAASSRMHLNSLFVSFETNPEFAGCEQIRNLIPDARFQARLAAIRSRDQIDYDAVSGLKEEIFRILWQDFRSHHLNPETARGESFRRFQHEGGPLLLFFACYETICEKYGEDPGYTGEWRDFPEPLRDPAASGVGEFIEQNRQEIEYHQYKQWIAAEQLASVGRRSMELGLKVGLLAELPFGHSGEGFESWYYQDLLCPGGRISQHQPGEPGEDPSSGLPLTLPRRLRDAGYQPLIMALRHTMMPAGAIIIRSINRYWRINARISGSDREFQITVQYPFAELSGIIALESQRNRCLVIVDCSEQLPPELQSKLAELKFFTLNPLFRAQSYNQSLLEDTPAEAVISSSASFIAGLHGLWKGRDIMVKTKESLFSSVEQREDAILTRATDRARLLLRLEREELLPEGASLHQPDIQQVDKPLMTAIQALLARSTGKILLITFNDLLDREQQPGLPVMSDQSYWLERVSVDLGKIFENREVGDILLAVRRERGRGVSRPSALAPDRKKRKGLRMPTAFYRLQLHKGFTFLQAAEIVSYLSRLGISHCYVSPFLKARPGSTHGYDIIDHYQLNPEIGSREDFEKFMAVLDGHNMALLLDIVPNHMGIGSDNRWWVDMLENGQSAVHAGYFDINWQPLQWDMAGRVLLPVLGDHYSKTLENGRLILRFHENTGSFWISYFEHRFPLDPSTYPEILRYDLGRLEHRLGPQHNGFLEYQNIISSFSNLPARENCSQDMVAVRNREKEINKRLLARLCGEHGPIQRFIEENVILFNGTPGKVESFDLLDLLLESQAYRLTFWRVAADEINYRRFFDINELAGLRMEERVVFEKTHALVCDLVATGKVDGVRVDHPDGLYNPQQYFSWLQAASVQEHVQTAFPEDGTGKNRNLPVYVVVEKILSDFEHLPRSWAVHGTTGYEVAWRLNGLFVDPAAESAMTRLYHEFIGEHLDFEEILYNCKNHIMTSVMVGELNVLTSVLFRLARADRSSRDFTLNLLKRGLMEIISAFPVYRTYISSKRIERRDFDYIQWAVARARSRHPFTDESVLDYIEDVLLLRNIPDMSLLPRYLDFVMKLQQYTGPVMAKGMEDTAFYIFNRLLSLNEVGANPTCFGVSVKAFHQASVARMRHWPNSMVSTTTHDSKRSEDVRARINVLSECVGEWSEKVYGWSMCNRPLKVEINGLPVPCRNDEYAFYQNLLGAWPDGATGDMAEHGRLVERMVEASVKGCREAKRHTSWVSPNVQYETALIDFVRGVLSVENHFFFDDFLPFHNKIAWFGKLNSLAQTFLKLVVPGIPDIYQGNELWRYCLVDPDNRRAVDFTKRQRLLAAILEESATEDDPECLHNKLLGNFSDGQSKLYTIQRTLSVRNELHDVFERGIYIPLQTTGDRKEHLIALMRKHGDRLIVAAAPRLCFTLTGGRTEFPLGRDIWGETSVVLPPGSTALVWKNVFSNKKLGNEQADTGRPRLRAELLFGSWPVALLEGVAQTNEIVKEV